MGTLPYQARGQITFLYQLIFYRHPFYILEWMLPNFGIRAIAEELAEERGAFPEGSDKSDFELKTLKKKADLGRPDFAGKGDKSFWYFPLLIRI